MSISSISEALSEIPIKLREPLIKEFSEALDEFRAADWEKVGIKAGKFCEIAYCVCSNYINGDFGQGPSKPKNYPLACQSLEQHNAAKGRSLCIQIPKTLVALYELRNNRAIGHVSTEISPNHMDAEFFVRGMKWIMGELVRQFSKLPHVESHALIEAITARIFSIVWSSGEVRRILEPARTASQRVLILLYAEGKAVSVPKLQQWAEYKNATDFKRRVLKQLHKSALIHFDEKTLMTEILPTGQIHVENSGLLIF